MQKIFTLSNKTDFLKNTPKPVYKPDSEPKQETLNRILQFAASYRAQRITDNQYVELFLN